jgi:hypothetical protein
MFGKGISGVHPAISLFPEYESDWIGKAVEGIF